MSAAADQAWDDWMDVADALGVTAPTTHPRIQDRINEVAAGDVLLVWSQAAAGIEVDIEELTETMPIPYVLAEPETAEPDHAECEHDGCETVVCCCDTEQPCPSTVEQACQHHELLCDVHRLDCTECLDDFRSDGGF